MSMLKKFIQDESGQSTTEYILILAVVVMVAMKFKQSFQGKLNGIVEKLGNDIGTAVDQN